MKLLSWIITLSFLSFHTTCSGSEQEPQEPETKQTSTFKAIRLYDQAILEKLQGNARTSKKTMRKAARRFSYLPDVHNLIARLYCNNFVTQGEIKPKTFVGPAHGAETTVGAFYHVTSSSIERYYDFSQEGLLSITSFKYPGVGQEFYIIGYIFEHKYKNIQEAKRCYTMACENDDIFRGIWGLAGVLTKEEQEQFKFNGKVPFQDIYAHFLAIDEGKQEEPDTFYKLSQVVKEMQCLELSKHFLATAARLGHAEAQYQMRLTSFSDLEALYWIILATLGGHYEAASKLVNEHAGMYFGASTTWDPKGWLPLIQKRAESAQATPLDHFVLGLMYQRGIILKKDLSAASLWLGKAYQAEPTNPTLKRHQGILLCEQGNYNAALPYLERAKDLNETMSYYYSWSLLQSSKPKKEAAQKALTTLKQLALKGNEEALLALTSLKNLKFDGDLTAEFVGHRLTEIGLSDSTYPNSCWLANLRRAELYDILPKGKYDCKSTKLSYLDHAMNFAPDEEKHAIWMRFISEYITNRFDLAKGKEYLEKMEKVANDKVTYEFLGRQYMSLAGALFETDSSIQKGIAYFLKSAEGSREIVEIADLANQVQESFSDPELEQKGLTYLQSSASSGNARASGLLGLIYQAKTSKFLKQAGQQGLLIEIPEPESIDSEQEEVVPVRQPSSKTKRLTRIQTLPNLHSIPTVTVSTSTSDEPKPAKIVRQLSKKDLTKAGNTKLLAKERRKLERSTSKDSLRARAESSSSLSETMDEEESEDTSVSKEDLEKQEIKEKKIKKARGEINSLVDKKAVKTRKMLHAVGKAINAIGGSVEPKDGSKAGFKVGDGPSMTVHMPHSGDRTNLSGGRLNNFAEIVRGGLKTSKKEKLKEKKIEKEKD